MVIRARNLLVLFDENALATQIVVDHLEAFRHHSRHRVFYYSCRRPATPAIRAEAFDAIIVHFSARLPFESVIHPSLVEALAASRALKIAMPQDEYDMPFVAARKMRAMGVDVVFTTVPPQDRDKFYPQHLVGPVGYYDNLTGYVPEPLLTAPRRSHSERPFDMVYRGNELPPWYGALGRQKYEIGLKLASALEDAGLRPNIASNTDERIYGTAWAEFLASGRTMCATESGSNVLDGDGSATRAAQKAMADDPSLTWREVYERHIRHLDNQVEMNQISPKIFEAVALETGLVLFEGRWSGILEPIRHYIPLRKDYANLAEVIERLRDVGGIEAMARRAYREIGLNPAYRYEALIQRVDDCIDGRAPSGPVREWTGAMTAVWSNGALLKLASDAMPLMQPWALPGRGAEAQGAAALEVLRQRIEDGRRAVPHYRLHAGAARQGVTLLGAGAAAEVVLEALSRYQEDCAGVNARTEAIADELAEQTARLIDELVRDESLVRFAESRSRELQLGLEKLHSDFQAVSEAIRALRRTRPIRALLSRAVGYAYRRFHLAGTRVARDARA